MSLGGAPGHAQIYDRPVMRSAPFVAAAAATLVAAACGSSAATPSATTTAAPGLTMPRVPARDRFIGSLSAGTGTLAGAGDVVEARLQAPGTTGTRQLTLWILSTRCRRGRACSHLGGSLRGQLTPEHSLPDVGHRYAVTARGSLHPLGAVTVTGTAAGTGNINFGFESLQLTLTGKDGSGRLIARSGRVPAFTYP